MKGASDGLVFHLAQWQAFGVSLCDHTDLGLGFLILLLVPTPVVVVLEEVLPRSETCCLSPLSKGYTAALGRSLERLFMHFISKQQMPRE